MKYVLISLFILLAIQLAAVSIYEIQYTSSPGVDYTYPSPYAGRSVSVEGIVTATDYRSGGYFISEPINGPWRGIFVQDRRNNPAIGDKIQIDGVVRESFGMTCISDISSFRILDSNVSLPQPITLTTAQLSRSDEAEAYEGVFVRVLSTTSSQVLASNSKLFVTDGTGQCQIKISEFGSRNIPISVRVGDQFTSISGIVTYSFGEYSLNPRNRSDIVLMQPVFNQNRSWGRIKSIYK